MKESDTSRTKAKYIYRIRIISSIDPADQPYYEIERQRNWASWPRHAAIAMVPLSIISMVVIGISHDLTRTQQASVSVIVAATILGSCICNAIYDWKVSTDWQASPDTPLSDALAMGDSSEIHVDPATLVRSTLIPEGHHATLDQLTRDNESGDQGRATCSSSSGHDSIATRIRRDLA